MEGTGWNGFRKKRGGKIPRNEIWMGEVKNQRGGETDSNWVDGSIFGVWRKSRIK